MVIPLNFSLNLIQTNLFEKNRFGRNNYSFRFQLNQIKYIISQVAMTPNFLTLDYILS